MLLNAAGAVLAAGVFAVELAPLAVLISHMVRVAAIARRSAAFGLNRIPEQYRRSRGQERDERDGVTGPCYAGRVAVPCQGRSKR